MYLAGCSLFIVVIALSNPHNILYLIIIANLFHSCHFITDQPDIEGTSVTRLHITADYGYNHNRYSFIYRKHHYEPKETTHWYFHSAKPAGLRNARINRSRVI
tara:strand:+ start:269 stop:577 length:309 start_codon:yes stop_codon:yes gene_type:complete